MRAIFVAGTGTEIGKTYVSAALVQARLANGRAIVALKPVASGVDPVGSAGFSSSDTARLLTAQGLAQTPEHVDACSPWRFAAPLSPDMAARAEGRSLTLQTVLEWYRARIAEVATHADVLIEGAGGVMSPIADDGLNLDLIVALDLPVLLVCGSYLGAISHTLTAVEALRRRGARLAALALNEQAPGDVELEATAAALRRFGDLAPILVRHGGVPSTDLWPL